MAPVKYCRLHYKAAKFYGHTQIEKLDNTLQSFFLNLI